MAKLRLLFAKEEQASYISHLDLLRTFQRSFPRSGLEIKHSQGYHPHPILSIVLPLPVGQSSRCELLDFEVTQETEGQGIARRLNEGLPHGLQALSCYPALRPVRELCALRATVTLEYDGGVPQGAAEEIATLLRRSELIIEKRTKHKELAQVNISPMLYKAAVEEQEGALQLFVTVQAQNPGLNPQLLEQVVRRYAPFLTPDYVRVHRTAILDADGKDFR